MKKTFLTIAATLACVAAFAQGKISFQNDSVHLVYYDSSTGGALSGKGVNSDNMPAGVTLVADLYMGTSSSSLNLYSTTSFGATVAGPGKWNAASVLASSPFIGGGTSVFVVTQIRDSSFAAPAQWTPATAPFGTYYGTSQEFTYTLGSAPTYPPMWNTAGTWAAGTFDMSATATPGSKGAIAVSSLAITPEPGTMALAGLGAAAMMVFRRRKQ